ncbi:hypothetical protein MNEG_1794 [Monoraphidium neglectum]|uniref:Protein kinase domain-containing protein n=1 Tax=Monoraphidium neglectum TaxID=145388 RepID=A0A0D2NP17_9CHLO|nr:hypothetical protein MNEG_1794 [Monoraphidium neglectum]KIZ06161.1 hypothetical protein MNEG_1794 [Monoraphidium neglectum]|eukprot:XP_013905180.1 hypothetical protein MNEG_1794 [Monoraphidium neglectum]
MVLTGNVTLAPHPALPRGGFNLTRPVVLLGQDGATTGIDFGGKINLIRLSGYGNLTFDSLALDNLFPGDEVSMEGVSGLSATMAYAVYAVKWHRDDRRMFVVRCTMAVPDQAQIERLKFFFAIFNSVDPELRKQAEWMRSGPRSAVSQISVDQRPGVHIVLFINKAVAYKDTYVQAANVVAPRIPFNASASVFTAAEKAAEAVGSPLDVPPITGMLKGPQDLLSKFPLTRPTTILIVPPQGTDLSPSPANGWPPPGGLVVTPGPVPNSLLFMGDIPTNTTPAPPGAPPQPPRPGAVPVHPPLWFGWETNLIVVPPQSPNSVQLRGLSLLELLLVPGLELRHIRRLAERGPSFDIPLQGGRALLFRGAAPVGEGSVFVQSYQGAGLAGSRLLFTEDRAPQPPGYNWPESGGGPAAAAAARLPTWASAVIGVCVAAAAVGLLLCVLLPLLAARRRRARRQRLLGGGSEVKEVSSSGGARVAGSKSSGGADGCGADAAPARDDAQRTLAAAAAAAAADRGAAAGAGDSQNGTGVAVLVQQAPAGGSASSPASDDVEGRWQLLSRKIGKRIGRIHMHRLAAALADSTPPPLADASAAGVVGVSRVGGGTEGDGEDGGGAPQAQEPGQRASPSPLPAVDGGAGRSCPSLDLQLLSPIGQGSFGTVWRGLLQGRTEVAVKLMQLPGLSALAPSGAKAASIRERMVVQEAAIASAVAHPHVVSVFSVGLRPCRPPQQEPAQGDGRRQQAPDPPAPATPGAEGDAVLWQLTIVMEYCDQGTLRQALDRGRLRNPRTGRTHLPTALALAKDVAAALQYLHTQQVIHGDIKASNVLLKTAPPARRGGGGVVDGGGGGAAVASSGANLIQGGWTIAKVAWAHA